MKRNVTITLDEETALWARVEAARRDTSVSQLVGELLRDLMVREQGYETALAEYAAGWPRRLKTGQGYPARGDLYREGVGGSAGEEMRIAERRGDAGG